MLLIEDIEESPLFDMWYKKIVVSHRHILFCPYHMEEKRKQQMVFLVFFHK